jgi:N-hydroxyarylamine O-acetyltransferase
MAATFGIDVAAYLARIGHRRPVIPTVATLRTLHLAHLPFENLDIHRGRPIRLEEEALFDKIVHRRRGGFCFELNGLFAALLRAIGFEVSLMAAQFPREPGRVAPATDHVTLLVRPHDSAEPWLADVGAGRGSFVLPLRAESEAEQPQPEAAAIFRLAREDGDRRLLRRDLGQPWERSYRFSLAPHRLADFAEGCRFHETSSDSHFTRGRICTILTADGRLTLAERRLITTVNGRRTEWELTDEADVERVLRLHFGIDREE